MRKLIDKKKQRINTKDKLHFLMLEKYFVLECQLKS